MKYARLEIPEVVLCEPNVHKDIRGFVYESFKRESFNGFLGIEIDFCQDNVLYSNYGVIRGLHTNESEYSQSKLVSVQEGKILDVVVDFRVGSTTFGQHLSIELSSENKKQLFVPRGFLHGFAVLSDSAVVNMKVDRYFAPGKSIGVQYDDKDLAINWKLMKQDIIIGEGDKNLPAFKEVISPFEFDKNYY